MNALIVMHRQHYQGLKPNWDVFVQIISRVNQSSPARLSSSLSAPLIITPA
jgi:hypothetical protein